MEKYEESQLVAVAQRENNQKRGYLVVNPLQGKHVPVSPTVALDLFTKLAKKLLGLYENETLLFIGFSETATAIGAQVALTVGGYYLQTTREQMENVEFFQFSESHSHATEQKISKTDVDSVLDKVQRIVFVEDEVTTGNTIMNIIEIMRKTYDTPPAFTVLSILNGMNEEALQSYERKNIDVHYLVKTDHSDYEEKASKFLGNGVKRGLYYDEFVDSSRLTCRKNYVNTRRVTETSAYKTACEDLFQWITEENIPFQGDILVLGTEECMFPALFVGKRLEEQGCTVSCHATTRSPISVSEEEEYPLKERWEVLSFYDKDRKTYIYDLKKYDTVLIISDAVYQGWETECSLGFVLESLGNQSVYLVNWCE